MIVEPLQMIVAAAFPNAKLPAGFTREQIAAAEARLGLVLPEVLKDFFTVAGGSRDLMGVNYRMLPPEKLRIDGEHLIFCAENQGLQDYGMPIEELRKGTEDPNPTVRLRRKGASRWTVEASELSAFLLGTTAWQAVLSLPEKARCEFPEDDLPKLLAFFEPVGEPDVRLGGDMFALVNRQRAVVAAYIHTSETLYVGSSDETVLEELEEKLQLDFDSL